MALTTERTTFSLDILGRYTANTWDEVLASADQDSNPHARPFDLVILGGGTFGCVLASRLFNRDRNHAHRILVIEAGPMALPEHVQNMPLMTADEVWGVPWDSDSPQAWNRQFPGLAYCIGGRSVYWGGWSPHFLDSEVPSPPWPADVQHDLMDPVLTVAGENMSYLDYAARQLGADSDNDFVYGPLHDALRDRLFDGIRGRAPSSTELLGRKGTALTGPPSKTLKKQLEAPLAVESTSPRPGFLPFNKFSAVPLLVRAARAAQAESGGADFRKRLMVLDNTKVVELERANGRITGIVTNRGRLPVPADGKVFLGLGTIENTRLALQTLGDPLAGRNLMAHLRSNLTFRVPRSAFAAALDPSNPLARELQVSALFVKGVHHFADGSRGHFHVQVTASGLGEAGRNSETELFKKVPDIDLLDRFRTVTDQWIVVTLRGIGEMTPDTTPAGRSRVMLGGAPRDYDYGRPRAIVSLEPSGRDMDLWRVMDDASLELAAAIAGGAPIQYLAGSVWQSHPPGDGTVRDKLSTTHHEAGTLWMGDDPATSVTDSFGAFHRCANLYALGPCLLPTIGSPNPVLSGVALTRHTADRVVVPQPAASADGFRLLFDGTADTFNRWEAVGAGSFTLVDGMIVAQPGNGLGLLYYTAEQFDDFRLRLRFRLHHGAENSGVHVRFRNPRRRVPNPASPGADDDWAYENPAWVAVHTGFEVQIDELARPDGLDQHRTGAVYGIPLGDKLNQQQYQRPSLFPPDAWNTLEVQVIGQEYTVLVNGVQASQFSNGDKGRGRPASDDPESGFVGIQAHSDLVAFRDIEVKLGT